MKRKDSVKHVKGWKNIFLKVRGGHTSQEEAKKREKSSAAFSVFAVINFAGHIFTWIFSVFAMINFAHYFFTWICCAQFSRCPLLFLWLFWEVNPNNKCKYFHLCLLLRYVISSLSIRYLKTTNSEEISRVFARSWLTFSRFSLSFLCRRVNELRSLNLNVNRSNSGQSEWLKTS